MIFNMPAKHTWAFKARLRARAFGWNGSSLACQRLKAAVAEIKRVARVDPVTAGAIQRILEGYGYELTGSDVIDAHGYFMAAADKLGVTAHARNDVLAIATKAKQNGAAFSDILIRHCSPDLQVCDTGKAVMVGQRTWIRTWTKRRAMR